MHDSLVGVCLPRCRQLISPWYSGGAAPAGSNQRLTITSLIWNVFRYTSAKYTLRDYCQ